MTNCTCSSHSEKAALQRRIDAAEEAMRAARQRWAGNYDAGEMDAIKEYFNTYTTAEPTPTTAK